MHTPKHSSHGPFNMSLFSWVQKMKKSLPLNIRLADFKPISLSLSISNGSADLSLYLHFFLPNSFICRWRCNHGQARSLLRHRPKRLVYHHRLLQVEKCWLWRKQLCHLHRLSFPVSHRHSFFWSRHTHPTHHSLSTRQLSLWTSPLPCQPHFSSKTLWLYRTMCHLITQKKSLIPI